MNCKVCGNLMEEDEEQCSNCKEIEGKVQVLTQEEKQHFNGITLEQDQQEEQGNNDYQTSNGNQHMYTKQFNLSSTSLLTKLVLGMMLLGLVVIALPIALLVISVVGFITFMVRK